MRLIDADLMFECETCRYCRNGKCNAYCDHGEVYSPDMSKLPTIDPEELRPKGRWKKQEQEIFCTHCGEEIGYTWAGTSRYSDYCPNCGAKMEV